MNTTPSPVPPKHCADCVLRRQPGFTSVTPEQLACIESFRADITRVRAGQAVVPEHRASARLFTLYSGWAFRHKSLADGRRQILNFLLPGDLIGLQAEFIDEATHGVEALTDVQLCVFPQDRLWALFQQQPQLGYDLTWLCASEEQLVDENLVTVGRRSAAERIGMLLLRLYKRAAALGMVRQGRVPFPINQQHIADAVGLSLVHTNKTMRRLVKLGLFEIADGWLALPQPKVLARLADFYDQPVPPRPLI